MPDTNPAPSTENISFLKSPPTQAGPALWSAAVVAFAALLALNLYTAIAQGERSVTRLAGRAIAVLLVPAIAVWFASRSESGQTQRAKVKVVFLTCTGFLALGVFSVLVTAGYVSAFGH